MNIHKLSALAILAVGGVAPALAQVTFYENDNYQGRAITTQRSVPSFLAFGFNDRASSIVVSGQLWEVCDNTNFGGSCRVLRPGSYPSLRDMGMNDRISSVRRLTQPAPVAEERYAPPAPPGFTLPAPRHGTPVRGHRHRRARGGRRGRAPLLV
jgi:hypothetical protein